MKTRLQSGYEVVCFLSGHMHALRQAIVRKWTHPVKSMAPIGEERPFRDEYAACECMKSLL